MVISHSAEGNVVAKTKATTFSLGTPVRIGDYAITGAGEYDISSVHVEVQNLGVAALAYWLHAEDLHITFLSQISPEIADQDGAANTDILVVDLRSDDTPDQLKPILKKVEPAYLFLIGSGATAEFIEALGLPRHEGPSLKVQRSSIPMEGTTVVAA